VSPTPGDVGASIGVFTQLLARRCSRVLAIDASEVGHSALKSRTEMWILATYTEEAFLLDVFRRRATPA
jgi:2-polyprenyl-3-methyl-5-hydroxy-6-metoxy-1,4-benzoquinol methylase